MPKKPAKPAKPLEESGPTELKEWRRNLSEIPDYAPRTEYNIENVRYFVPLVPGQKARSETLLLFDYKNLDKKIVDDSRSLNCLIIATFSKGMNSADVKKIWKIYKEALKSNRANPNSATLLVQACSMNVAEIGFSSRVYYIRKVHQNTLNSRTVTHRFYINLVHTLLALGPKYLARAYDHLDDDVVNISPSDKDQYKSMLDAAVVEYNTYGLRPHITYPDDYQIASVFHAQQSDAEQILQKMECQVDKHITRNYFIAVKSKENKQNFCIARKYVIPMSFIEKIAADRIHKVSLNQDWNAVLLAFDETIKEIPESTLIYNAMLTAAIKLDRHLYAKILYVQTVNEAHSFADLDTHMNALILFEKSGSDFEWAEYAYNEIKRLGNLNEVVCNRMIQIAMKHQAKQVVEEVLLDAKTHDISLNNEIKTDGVAGINVVRKQVANPYGPIGRSVPPSVPLSQSQHSMFSLQKKSLEVKFQPGDNLSVYQASVEVSYKRS